MSTQLTTTASKNDIRTLLAKPETIHELGRVATKYLTADRLARLVLSACNRVPKLLECTPQSVLQCAITCSQYGVEPDGRHAHLIPYGAQCTLIVDWKGLVALGRRGGVEDIVPDTICENDEFVYYRDEAGTHFKHVPKFGNRGSIIGAYSTAKIDGKFDVEVMTVDEIEGIRKRSRAGNSGPWQTDFGEMCKKTAIRRHSKRWPLAPEIAEAFNADDDKLNEIPQHREVRSPIFTTPAQQLATPDDDQVPDAEIPAKPKRTYTRRQPAEPPIEATPDSNEETPPPPATPREQFAKLVQDAGFGFEDARMALVTIYPATESKAELWTGFDDIQNSVCSLAMSNKDAVIAQLEAQKEA